MMCSCGNDSLHRVQTRSTADGIHVVRWSDGTITWALGQCIGGAPRKAGLFADRVSELVMANVELYDSQEIPLLVKAARWCAKRTGSTPADVRAKFAELSAPTITPKWVVLSTDRDGRPIVRVWRLPRLLYSGACLWHERGSYWFMNELRRTGTFVPTGFRFKTLKEALLALPKLRVTEVQR